MFESGSVPSATRWSVKVQYDNCIRGKGKSSWLLQDQVYAALAVQEQVEALGSILLLMLKQLLITQITSLTLSMSLSIGDLIICKDTTTQLLQ